MRDTIKATILTAVLMMLGCVSVANAQLGQYSLRFTVPFTFMVENRMFPAGEYRIQRLSVTGDPSHMLTFRGPNGRTILFSTIPHESAYGYSDSAITLQRVDGRYHLSKIMIEGMLRGYEVPVSRFRRDYTARVVTIRSGN